MQVILRQLEDCIIRRAEPSDLIPVMEINLKTLPEHYSDYFYESLLAEIPEAFIVAEIGGKHVGYIMCKTEYGFSNFKKLGFVKKGHVVSIAVLNEYRKRGIGGVLVEESVNGVKLKNYMKNTQQKNNDNPMFCSTCLSTSAGPCTGSLKRIVVRYFEVSAPLAFRAVGWGSGRRKTLKSQQD